MPEVNLLVAVHEELMAQGIRALIERNFNLDFNIYVSTLDEKNDILDLCRDEEIEIVILDMDHPLLESFTLLEELSRQDPEIRTISITGRKTPQYLEKIVKAGAQGLVLKSCSMDVLKNALQKQVEGNHFICNEATLSLVRESEGDLHTNNEYTVEDDLLTEREIEVLGLICQEMTNPQIAEKLQLSVRTIDAHRRNLLQKTGAANTVGLVIYAFKNQLLKIQAE
ncbi:MAG: response regulator transcription factor [Balneolaceae bacterium]|nr:response regulator transcription factor [Balneolaceae bacterium]